MKIVEAIHCCVPGGAEMFVKELIINMKNIENNNKYELWIIHDAVDIIKNKEDAIKFENEYIKELEENGVVVKKISKKEGFINRIKMYKKIRKMYKEFKPDIIHTHLENTTFHICTALMLSNVKIVQTIHNEKIAHKYINRFLLSKRTKNIISIADKVSNSIENNIKCKKEKIIKIYNGVNIEKFLQNRTFEKKNEPVRIVAVGRLTKQKNYKFLLESFNELTQKCYDDNVILPILEIYGQGEEKEELEQYAKNNDIKNVKFMGISKEINKVLKNSDIYVLSSIFEGFSISLIEALVSGIAIVCTDVGGNKEIIGKEAGILVESNNIEQMTEALYNLLDEKNRKAIYEKCLERNKMFDIQTCARKHLELYENKKG